MKGRNQYTVSQKMMNDELASLIKQIVDLISSEDMKTEVSLARRKGNINSLEDMAKIAELKIQSKQINDIRRKVLEILSKSKNRLVIATIEYYEN